MDAPKTRQELKNILRNLLPNPSAPIALLDFPNYLNVGDNAIWLGEIELLTELNFKVEYLCTVTSYNPTQLGKAVKKNGVILISGGGNFGDLWIRHEKLRRKVVADFPNHQIIQLPQSIHYQSDEELGRTCEIFNKHPNLTILTRDNNSFTLARKHFNARLMMCPDMAFGLKKLSKLKSNPKYNLLWLIRKDKEAKLAKFESEFADKSEVSFDWGAGYHSQIDTICSGLLRISRKYPAMYPFIKSPLLKVANRAALLRMNFGLKMLSEAKMVVTDRLHGHIICFLLGIPHVSLDNSYGKISGFMDAWKTDKEGKTYLAQDINQAREIAKRLIESPEPTFAS